MCESVLCIEEEEEEEEEEEKEEEGGDYDDDEDLDSLSDCDGKVMETILG